jgi:hypothetical protein
MMHGYRFKPENEFLEADKASLYLPAQPLPVPRTLVSPESYRPPSVTPGPRPMSIEEKTYHDPVLEGLTGQLRQMITAMRELHGRQVNTREIPFSQWRVDQVILVNTATTWLDERNPASTAPANQRYLQGRRALTIVNHDTTNHIFIRHVDAALGTSGGYIAAGGSISLPLGNSAKIWATASAATSTISFYQFA